MQSANSNILIISNMGPKPSSPFQGQFVQRQAEALHAEYHYMRWHTDSLLNRLLKYPVFIADFIGRYLLCRKTFAIVHVHFFYPTIWLALLYKGCRNPNVQIIVSCHGSDIYKYQPPGALYRWCAAKVNEWIFASRQLAAHFFRPVAHSHILSAGIAAPFAAAEQVCWADKTIDLLYVGSLDHNKGMDRLIAMLPYLKDKRIVVAGNGPWLAQLQQSAAGYPNVQLIGAQDQQQLQLLYQQARCFISLSRNEAFGLVMAEAMACYTPVIATETDGALTQITAGYNGLLVSQPDEATLQRQFLTAIAAIWQLPAEQYQLWQQQAHQSAQPYLLPEVVKQLNHIYQRALNT